MKLTDPFPREKIKQKPGPGGRKLDFISHALVTERLNEVDPNWCSEVLHEHTYTDAGGRLHCEGVTLRLTVNGVSRVEAGGPQRQDGFANEIKNSYSDALKRAAMRFGVALGMWDSMVDSEYDEDSIPDEPATNEQRRDLLGLMDAVGMTSPPHRRNFVNKHLKVEVAWEDMTAAQVDALIRELQKRQDEQLAMPNTPAPVHDTSAHFVTR